MIDIHMHVGRLCQSEKKALTPSYLLKLMDAHGIEKAALLPIESPEETDYYVTTEEVLRVCRRHPDRFIPFCFQDKLLFGTDVCRYNQDLPIIAYLCSGVLSAQAYHKIPRTNALRVLAE